MNERKKMRKCNWIVTLLTNVHGEFSIVLPSFRSQKCYLSLNYIINVVKNGRLTKMEFRKEKFK